ncbi:hypothetical protein MTYP_01308 [Methylophilaceae bacterium]|nr:hypothetical protein MTYP_01308 [Methylophilaceae bacterium]
MNEKLPIHGFGDKDFNACFVRADQSGMAEANARVGLFDRRSRKSAQ